jgi:hypothetical protein
MAALIEDARIASQGGRCPGSVLRPIGDAVIPEIARATVNAINSELREKTKIPRECLEMFWEFAAECYPIGKGGFLQVIDLLVDLVGIEPTTSSMPWKRAPKLRHRPTFCSFSILADLKEIVKRNRLCDVQLPWLLTPK